VHPAVAGHECAQSPRLPVGSDGGNSHVGGDGSDIHLYPETRMSRIVSLIAAALALAACSNPTGPNSADQAAKAKAALAAASGHANGRLASN